MHCPFCGSEMKAISKPEKLGDKTTEKHTCEECDRTWNVETSNFDKSYVALIHEED